MWLPDRDSLGNPVDQRLLEAAHKVWARARLAVIRYLGEDVDAAEILETAVDCASRAMSTRGPIEFVEAYLLRSVARESIRRLRKHRRVQYMEGLDIEHIAGAVSLDVDRHLDSAKRFELFRACLDAGLPRVLAGVYTEAAAYYQATGDRDSAEHYSELSAAATQASGNLWLVPEHLRILAEFQMAKGKYSDADGSFERAEDFLDAIIGRASTRLEQTSVITASSEIYAQHFALIADHLTDPEKAYKAIEQVRGRTAADLLASGVVTAPAAKAIERAISRLRLKLMAARSNREVANLRDEIFLEEQSRWAVPGSSALKANSRETVTIAQLERSLPASAVLLEYVVAEPNSYCLAISRAGSHIVRLGGHA